MQNRVNRPESPAKRRGRLAEIHGDMFLEAWDAPAPKRRKGGHGSRDGGSRTAVAVNLLLLTCIAAMAALGGLLVYRHNVYLEMKQVVEAQTFYEGTTVDGMDVSDMTLVSALDYWQNRVEPAYSDRSVQVGEAGTVTARDLGYRSDYEEVLSNAWSAGRHGSLEQRYHSAVQRVAHPVAYSVDRAVYSTQLLDAYVRAMAAKIDTPAVDAGIASFDTSSYSFVFTESQTGRRLDAEGLKRQMAQVLDAGSGSVEVSVETVQPAVTTEEVSSRYGMIASAVTNASSSSSNRLKNIKCAMSYINGVCLKPGETFSFNKVVGRRTTDRGFRMATAYSGGSVTEEIGGGICQVSTTLFNCAVKSDLEIVERHNHSLTVGYVDKGKDATVNWDSQDLKFKNTTGGDVYICCLMTSDKRVRFAIFGKMLENGETITVEAVTTKTIKYDTQYEVNPLLPPGQSRVVEPGKNGYKAETYKVRWDAAGNQISKELLCKSFYKAKDQIIQVGQ
ncbi:MAG: VanW family protein [Clostridia bacterium]|nr:VanW family protein [Clostridia bacterium]